MKCPEQNDFKFEFEGQCPITTCQYCNRTTANGCLARDRRESSDRPITVAELQLYKGPLHPEFSLLSRKASEALVRNTVTRVKDITAVYLYVSWLDSYVPTPNRRNYKLDETLTAFLSRINQHLPEFKPWMFPYLFSKSWRTKFFAADGKEHGILSLNIGNALGIHNKRLAAVLDAIRRLPTTSA